MTAASALSQRAYGRWARIPGLACAHLDWPARVSLCLVTHNAPAPYFTFLQFAVVAAEQKRGN